LYGKYCVGIVAENELAVVVELPTGKRNNPMKSIIKSAFCVSWLILPGFGAPIFAQEPVGDGQAESPVEEDDWKSRIEFSGDFRPRFEYIDRDENSIGEPVDERRRGRFRVRFDVTAEVNDNVDFIFGLASGGENPVSTNQSLDDGFPTKAIGINLAYANWHATENLDVMIGKVKNPFHRAGGHHLIWDSDLNPEGIAVQYDTDNFFAILGGYGLEERASSDDSFLYTLQGGYTFNLSATMDLTAGAGYYGYSNMKGNSPPLIGEAFGNSVDLAGNLIYEYRMVQAFVEIAMTGGKLPLSLFADYVQNTAAPRFDTGFAFGGKLGKVDEPGTWQASIAYQDLEADALLALYTDSDFGGGGTDATGFTLKAKYAVSRNWNFGGTLFINEIEENLGNPTDYNRLQVDFEFKF